MSAIRTAALSKYYGKVPGLIDLDLDVSEGEVFGYLGPNGAGKTTTIRLLLDLIRPTKGHVKVLGMDVAEDPVEVRRRTGYLPGELSLYEGLTGRQTMAYLGKLRGGVDMGYVEELAEHLELPLDRPVKDLSKGNKQKVGVLQAFMHKPELLILDEPTSGLDPLVQRNVHRLIRDAASEGRTVFLSSHVLSEVEDIADRIGIISRGHLVAIEGIADLKRRTVRRVQVHFGTPVPVTTLSSIAGVREVHMDDSTAVLKVEGTMDPLIKSLAAYDVVNLISHEVDLEEIFFAYYDVGDEA